MSDFVWILDADKSMSFGRSGVSSSYILPKGEMYVDPKSLAGNRIWVVLRGQEDRLFLSVIAKKIEKVIEGYHLDDHLLSVDLISSFRLVSNYADAKKYRSKEVHLLSNGLYNLPEDISEQFKSLVIQSVQVKFSPPEKKLLSNIDLKFIPNTGLPLAKSALRLVVSKLNLDQVWASGTGEKLGAFSNYARDLISEKINDQNRIVIVEEIKQLDPLVNMNGKHSKNYKKTSKRSAKPKVDTELTVIDPEKIYVREFVSIGDKFKNLEEALNKTEHAEKLHQDMLKDISQFLISQGIIPFESGSIDLMYQSKKELCVCEIKSSNLDNLLAQSAKGTFQLACYIDALMQDYTNPIPFLILGSVGDEHLETYVLKVLKRLGITGLFYDSSKNWPNRIQGLIK